MKRPTFRIKPYAHPKYKFVVRAKLAGKWRRSYFKTETEAMAFARQRNAEFQSKEKDRPERPLKRAKSKQAWDTLPLRGYETAGYTDNNFAQLTEATYTGPYIQRYFGDHWSMHLPFAYDLMREFRPKVFVELGVWKGESYFSFCQSAADHCIRTRCYGIDTWRGDVHMGDLDPEIGVEVAEYNRRYSSFSELRTRTFAEAVDEFADGTIDLLHIDGSHTYEDVKADFKAWLPKVSAQGIVLLHDVAVHDRGFGVWRLWEEIAKPGQCFLFEFGYGLGVWKKGPVGNSDSAWLRRLFELNHVEQKQINAYYLKAAVALALWHKTQDHKNREEMAKALSVQVFVDQVGSFSETSSITADLVPGRWQSIRFNHLEKLGLNRRGRIRLDPVNCLAIINISSIRLITDSDNRVFYSASSAADFAQIKVSEGVLKHETDGILELVASDNDPQVFLPELSFPSGDSWRLEVDLEVHTAPSNIILRQKETFAEIQALQIEKQRQKRDEEAQAKLHREQIASLENELRSSQRAAKQLQAASTQLSYELETERAQKNVVQGELEETRRVLLKSREETARLSGVLEIRNSNSVGLALYNARLRTRPQVSSGLLGVGVASKHGDAEMSSIADSIFEDIERIGHPSFLWRMAKAFGLLRFAEPGVPRTAADRRAIAQELKAAVREICKTLSSATVGPNEVAIKVIRLLELRRKTSEILRSVEFSTLQRLESAIWKIVPSERRALGSFSELTPASALFDTAWYLGQYPEVAALECDPLTHYLRRGAHEGRDPNPVFNTAWYLANNPNVTAAGLDPLEHYLEFGARAGSDPHPLFDSSWYLEQNPDLGSDINPLAHYLECGAQEGRDPHPLFSTSWYLAQNPEVAGLNPLAHYVKWGCHHRRSPHPLFDSAWYLEQYPDVASAGLDPLQDYLERGARAGRDPHLLFDSSWYLEQNPALGSDVNPLRHYLECGALEGRDPHPLFDSAWYMRQDPPLKEGEVNPLQHYLVQGADEGRSPHPLFDGEWYLEQYPDVAGLNPLEHYVRWGCHGRSPHPLFDSAWYLEQYPDVASAGLDPLQDYLECGARAGRDPHPLFDSSWYLEQNPALGSDVNPLRHYLECGALEARDPHPLFDTKWYLSQKPESVTGDVTPLAHYLTVGWRLGYWPNPRFDPQFYLRAYSDAAAANIEPLTHFVLQGRREGRKTTEQTISFEAYRPAFDIPLEPTASADPSLVPTVKAIAFYLPQFHPIPENDRWWGEGFTEWNNVRAGRPNFPGHYQPHVPIGLGYYDLRETRVLQDQTDLAKLYGIYGFCFYYYWFGGKVLLDLPIRRMLESGKPDFPFCVCWANENWTRRWDGRENDVLIAQSHSPEDDVNFIRRVENVLLRKNYIRVRGKPLLLVYRPSLFPDSLGTTGRWRDYFRRKGHGELHLVMVRSFQDSTAPEVYGFDAAVQFPPHFPTAPITSLIEAKDAKFNGTIYDYTETRRVAIEQLITASRTGKTYAAVMPSWDNTARRGSDAAIWVNSSPEAYYAWLSAAVEQVQKKEESDERLIFINAWNEWAEGCHLEPDERYKYAWLNATRLALEAGSFRPNAAGNLEEPYVLVISHDASLAGAQILLLNLLRQWKKRRPFAVKVVCVGGGELREEFEKCFPTLVLADFTAKAEQNYALAEFLRGSPRLIYSSTVVNGPLLAQLRPLGAKVLTHAHELQKSIERWAPGEIMTATLKHSDLFVAASPKIAENLSASHGVPKDHLHVVYAFIEPWAEEQEPTAAANAAMREELNIGAEDVVVFGCGTTDWRKGPDLFVEIARSACAHDSRLKFVWIGGDPAPFVENVRSAGLEGRVFFVGPRKEARRYYYAGQIFLLSSREDPCPLVALEAANAGLPIVCFADAGDIPGFVGEECGVVVPYEDVPAAAQAVVRLAGDTQLRRNLGAEARKRAVERHSSAGAALQIEALFDRLVPDLQPASTRSKPREEEPLVSVIVPNYNHGKYLPERLRSITAQTYKNMEIILLDDASTDNSRAILQKFAGDENRARFIPNDQNSGSTFKQWRKGLSQARGKYVWLAESDDTAEPTFLKTLVEKLEANPGLSLAYCQLQMVSPDGEKLGTPQSWLSEIDPLRWNTDFVNDGIDEIRRTLLVKNTILNASGVVFRNAEGIADLVDDSMRLCADWLFWVRLLQRGGVAYVANPLSSWRLQSSNARKRPAGELEWLEGERVLLEAAKTLKLTQPERDRILLDFLRKCWKWRLEAVS